ncbi:hypothetical protein LCGC14_1700610, partial [marine sediment metagenome]
MIEEIEKLLIEGNLEFQWKIIQGIESIQLEDKIPRYPVLILTCMDSRIDIHRIFQLKPGDVFILRNAGNIYTQDMLRSILLVIIEYNIKYIIILGHLDCGMTKIKLRELEKKIPHSFLSSLYDPNLDVFSELRKFFKPFNDELRNIKKQVETFEKIKEFFPMIKVTGMLYDVDSGWIFEYEKFKEFVFIDNFRRQYHSILTEKKDQFKNYLESTENEITIMTDLDQNIKELKVSELEAEQPPINPVEGDMEITNKTKKSKNDAITNNKEDQDV